MNIICLSVLLTSSMPAIKDTTKSFEKSGVRDKYYIMIDGAPVSQTYVDQIGADNYSSNAGEVAAVARTCLL